MKCNKCKAKLVKRTGPYGEFMACPNSKKGDNHGTRAIKNVCFTNKEYEEYLWLKEKDRRESEEIRERRDEERRKDKIIHNIAIHRWEEAMESGTPLTVADF